MCANAVQVRLSTLRYTRAKICGLCYAELEIRITHAYFLTVVKDRRSVQQFPIGTSPLPAERGIGLEPNAAKKNLLKIKNPATSAGRIRPLIQSRSTRAQNGCARNSSYYYPVFVTNLTSMGEGRPGPSADSPANQGTTNIQGV